MYYDVHKIQFLAQGMLLYQNSVIEPVWRELTCVSTVLLISTTEFPNVCRSFYDRNDLNYASVTYLIKSLDVLRHTDVQQCTASRS
jgi:hypothetical protein